MKIIIASDIHGCAPAARELACRIEEECPDRVALLGDVLYHGPRNDLPDGYAPKQVIPILNGFADRIVAVRGNCDSEVDQMVLDFPCLADFALIVDGARELYLTHGHLAGKAPGDLPSLAAGSVFMSGHTHVKVLERCGDVVMLNPGSTSIPKDGSASFAVYDSGRIALKSLSGETLRELSL